MIRVHGLRIVALVVFGGKGLFPKTPNSRQARLDRASTDLPPQTPVCQTFAWIFSGNPLP